MNQIVQLKPKEAGLACQSITATLPEWFGIPEANERYAKGVRERLALGYMLSETCAGLLSLEFPFSNTANIYWMGVKKEVHGLGIGQSLLQSAERLCIERNIYSLTVETLSPKEKDPNYLKTYEFYLSKGFKPLFELHTYSPDFQMVYLSKILSPKIFKWIDLTHDLSAKTPTWDGSCGFQHTDTRDGPFLVQHLEMSAGIGTHMDAPLHYFPQGMGISELSLPSLITPCVVINVSEAADEQYCVDLQRVKAFENKYGKIGKETFVIFYTGWERFWNLPEKYHNQHRFPTISKEAAEYLVTQDIAGIGIDTLSPDSGQDGFPVHEALLGSGKYIVENVANANLMPAVGGYTFSMPIKTLKGSEAPMRLLGMIPA